MVPIRRGLLVTTSSWLLLVLRAVQAQTPEFSLPPSSLLPNYGRVGIGQREAIEAGAYVARTDDALANWYNPAGLRLWGLRGRAVRHPAMPSGRPPPNPATR